MAKEYVYNVSIMHLDGKGREKERFLVKQTRSYDEASDIFIELVKRDMDRTAINDNPNEILENKQILSDVTYNLKQGEDYDELTDPHVTGGYALSTKMIYDYEHHYIGPGRFALEKDYLQ